MTIKATEVGKLFNYATFFDLSTAGATFELKIDGPDGQVIIPNARITAPSSPVTAKIEQADGTFTEVTLAADTYMQFSTLATDFPVAGTFDQYTICGTYNDATPKTFFGDPANFTVGAPC